MSFRQNNSLIVCKRSLDNNLWLKNVQHWFTVSVVSVIHFQLKSYQLTVHACSAKVARWWGIYSIIIVIPYLTWAFRLCKCLYAPSQTQQANSHSTTFMIFFLNCSAVSLPRRAIVAVVVILFFLFWTKKARQRLCPSAEKMMNDPISQTNGHGRQCGLEFFLGKLCPCP